jgi:hypothetical protein
MTLEKVDLVTTVFIMIIDIGFYEVGVISYFALSGRTEGPLVCRMPPFLKLSFGI